eukprot:gene10368-biopygen10604
MADGQGRSEGGRAFTLTPTRPAANCESNSGTEALLAQQTALLNTMLQQMKDLNTRVEALPYGPHVAGNPFPTRPATLETDVPQMFNLNNDKTYGALSKLTHSSMLCEHLVLAPALSPTRAKVHIGSSLFAWGNVLRLKRAARGFWADELRHLHITHLELEGVYKTVQSFMRELTGKVGSGQAAVQTQQPELVPGSNVNVYWPIDDAWHQGTVGKTSADGVTRSAYDDGDRGRLGAGRSMRPDTGVSMLRTHIRIAGDTVSVVPHKEKKGRRHVRLERRLTVPAAGVPGLVQLLQH